jgi:replicative DNA helicase
VSDTDKDITGQSINPDTAPNEDAEALQAIVLAAAINGNQQAHSRLPALLSVFDEPYRTIAAVINSKATAGQYTDRLTLTAALTGIRLTRRSNGAVQELSPGQAVNLLFATEVKPGQAEAYLEVLEAQLRQKRQVELKERAADLAKRYGDEPQRLLAEIQKLAADAHPAGARTLDHPSELLEVIPYVARLLSHQRGSEFLGLDSGFAHFNALCNGLDTGLIVLAAPPGRGKTTLAWQIACQTAEICQVPVIFISMEQSKGELRAKALARLSKLEYRHILRGRLRSDDTANSQKLLDAAHCYAVLGRHLTVVEGDENTTIDTIHQLAAMKLAQSGADRCLVVVDYLQILPIRRQDADRVTSPRDRVDLHVSALRRMARELDSPVLAISAENRAGYRSRQLDVFKESGGIEYSADIAMILTRDKQNSPAADAEFRNLDLNIVKNRNGECGVVKFRFYAARAEFMETGKCELPAENEEAEE